MRKVRTPTRPLLIMQLLPATGIFVAHLKPWSLQTSSLSRTFGTSGCTPSVSASMFLRADCVAREQTQPFRLMSQWYGPVPDGVGQLQSIHDMDRCLTAWASFSPSIAPGSWMSVNTTRTSLRASRIAIAWSESTASMTSYREFWKKKSAIWCRLFLTPTRVEDSRPIQAECMADVTCNPARQDRWCAST